MPSPRAFSVPVHAGLARAARDLDSLSKYVGSNVRKARRRVPTGDATFEIRIKAISIGQVELSARERSLEFLDHPGHSFY